MPNKGSRRMGIKSNPSNRRKTLKSRISKSNRSKSNSSQSHKSRRKSRKSRRNFSKINMSKINEEINEIERNRMENQLLDASKVVKLYKKDPLTFLAAALAFTPLTTDNTGSMVSMKHRRPVKTPSDIFVYEATSLNPKSRIKKNRNRKREEGRQTRKNMRLLKNIVEKRNNRRVKMNTLKKRNKKK